MNFEESYKKYKDGTATEEEKLYVESEIEKAKTISDMITPPKVAEVSEKEVEKIKKVFRIKTVIKALIITTIVVFAVAVATIGTIFGISVPAAKKGETLNRTTAEQIAIDYIKNNEEIYGKNAVAFDVDRSFEMEIPLKESYYEYEIRLHTDSYAKIEIQINGTNGKVVECDIEKRYDNYDRDDD